MRIDSRHARLILATSAIALVVPQVALAQGSLAGQGFGYPLGGMSARSQASGSSLAGIDPQTPLNPAAIVLNARAQAYGQYDPEFRTVTVGGVGTKTTTSRFPLFFISGHQGQATFALSFSSFMDRSWVNTYADTQKVGTERLASTVLTQSIGGISEGRAAFAWSFSERLHVGLGIHFYPGQNQVSVGRIFADSAHAGNFQVTNSYSFSGSAFSFGGVYAAGGHFILSGDLRVGNTLTMRVGDSTNVGEGKVPLRYGVSASYDGVPGAVFSARLGGDRWSDLKGLGSSSLGLKDALDMSVGTEITGPRLSGAPVMFRAGYRTRGLPFTYGSSAVTESSVAGGVGVPVIGGRAIIDFSAVHASRSSGAVAEKSLLLSIGIGIRP